MSEHVQGIAQAIEQLDVFDINTAEKALNDYAEKNDIKIGQMMQPLRVAISGAPMGPPFYDMLALLGKEIVVRRLHAAVSNIPVV